MPTISLSRHSVEGLLWLAEGRGPGAWADRVRDETVSRLKAALAPRPSPRRKAKPKGERAKNAETYASLFARANGRCECGCDQLCEFSSEVDHFWGRSKAPTTAETCWVLSRWCHRAKTDNKPDARHWLEKFRAHCLRYGFLVGADKARRRLEGMVAVREAEARR